MDCRSIATTFTFLTIPVFSFSAESEGKWIDLLKQVDTEKQAVQGTWTKSDNGLNVNAATGARLVLPFEPKGEYDFRTRFTRKTGQHSIALIFATPQGQATFEIDAWAENLAGIQNVNGQTMKNNSTRTTDQRLENDQSYTAMVQVRRDEIRVYLNEKMLSKVSTNNLKLSMIDIWKVPNEKALGIGAYESATTFSSVEVRSVQGETVTTKPMPTPTPSTQPREKPKATILLVIANQDFFYREYDHPKEELERVGFKVEVAAGRKAVCRPHPGSGQSGDGAVMPDLALSDVKVEKYDAIVFSGGWGSSMYQYAFTGRYNKASYNGDRQIKQTANTLINEFLKQKKYVGGICHGVSVLAWARVNNRSPLTGKRVVAPTISGPAGIYLGRQAQPPSRWNAQVNGARLLPAGSMGNRNSSHDDVAVDGNILTAENDQAARYFGKVLARLLLAKQR